MIKKILNSRFIRFCITGGLGTITNLIIFFIIADILNLSANVAAIVAFAFAVTQNYFINHFWSFSEYSKTKKVSFKDYLKFVSVSLLGLGINIIVLNLILYFFKPNLKVIAQVFGIAAGLIFNFFGSSRFVFKVEDKRK